jgi:Rrf2 family protein
MPGYNTRLNYFLYGSVDLSSKTEYALLALMELAKHFKDGEPIQTRQIAEQQKIPDRYLEQLMAILRQQGLVKSQRGAKGGYILGREPWQITVLEVVLAIEGKTSEPSYDSKSIESMVLSAVWQQAREEVQQIFQSCTLQELCDRRDNLVHSSITYYI